MSVDSASEPFRQNGTPAAPSTSGGSALDSIEPSSERANSGIGGDRSAVVPGPVDPGINNSAPAALSPFPEAKTKCCPYCGGTHPAGRFVAGCAGPRLQNGVHSRLLQGGQLPAQAEAAVALAAEQREMEEALGGSEAMSPVLRKAVRDITRLEMLGDHLFVDQLIAKGIITSRGRTRASLNAYLQVLDRLIRLRQMVGLQRVARHVDPAHSFQQRLAAGLAAKAAREQERSE